MWCNSHVVCLVPSKWDCPLMTSPLLLKVTWCDWWQKITLLGNCASNTAVTDQNLCTLWFFTVEGRVVFCNYTGSSLDYQAAQVKVCKMCVSVHIFQKAFCPIISRQMIGTQPNFYDGLPLSTACPMQNDSYQIHILSSENVPTCAGVRPSSPYYRVRIGWWNIAKKLALNQGSTHAWSQVHLHIGFEDYHLFTFIRKYIFPYHLSTHTATCTLIFALIVLQILKGPSRNVNVFRLWDLVS